MSRDWLEGFVGEMNFLDCDLDSFIENRYYYLVDEIAPAKMKAK